jgi:hypothetical protein
LDTNAIASSATKKGFEETPIREPSLHVVEAR